MSLCKIYEKNHGATDLGSGMVLFGGEVMEECSVTAMRTPSVSSKLSTYDREFLPQIPYEDFAKLDLRVVTVTKAELHPRCRSSIEITNR